MRLFKILSITFTLIFSTIVYAQETITAIIPFSPSGGTDISMKHFQKYLEDKKNIKIVFSYRPGAEGVVGLRELNNSPKNGSVVGFTTIASLAEGIKNNLDFEYISATRKYAQVFLIHNSVNVDRFDDLIKRVNQGDKFNFGYGSPAQLLHIKQIPDFEKSKETVLIPYKGAGPLMNDLIGGHINIGFLPISVAEQHINTGKVKILASSTPLKQYSNITIIPKKYPDWKDIGGYCIVFPKNTDPKILDFWKKTVKEYLDDPQTNQEFEKESSERYPFGETFLRNLVKQINDLT